MKGDKALMLDNQKLRKLDSTYLSQILKSFRYNIQQ